MAKDWTKDTDLEKRLKTKLDELKGRYSARKKLLDDAELMYNLDWKTNEPDDPALSKTKTTSPDPFNKCNGAIRLLTAANPNITIPYDANNLESKQASDKMERYINTTISNIDRIRGKPLVVDAAVSAIVLNGCYGAVVPTSVLLASVSKNKKKDPRLEALKKRYERIANLTPFLVELYDARTVYPEFDQYGLVSFGRSTTRMRAADAVSRWGDKVYDMANINPDKLEDVIDGDELWDDALHATWVNGKIVDISEHGYPCMPCFAYVVEGTHSLFSKADYEEKPFLFALNKSNLWVDKNMALTAMYSNIMRMGSNAQFVYETQNPLEPLAIDYSVAGGVVTIAKGDSVTPLEKRPIDPAMLRGIEIADQSITASTIYDQTLGAPIGASTTFSATALLSQQGRVVLVPAIKALSNTFGKIAEIMLEMTRAGFGGKAQKGDSVVSLDKADIPESLYVDAVVDVKMPQDTRENALVAIQLTNAGLASKRYVRENFLQIGQSVDMDKEILDEQTQLMVMQQEAQNEAMQQQQQGVSPEQAQGMQQGGGTAPGQPAMAPSGPMPAPGQTEQIPEQMTNMGA